MLLLLTAVAFTGLTSCAQEQPDRKQGQEQMQHQESDGEQTQQYTCPMHPEVVSDQPGECPECGMDLVPMDEVSTSQHDAHDHSGEGTNGTHEGHSKNGMASGTYTCPMHPDVISDSPGECPECGMDLVPVEEVEDRGADMHEHSAATGGEETSPPSSAGERKEHADHSANADSGKQLWTCSMHPNVIREEPGDCPICGMDLVRVKQGSQSGGGFASTITIDPVVVQNMGVRTAPVRERALTREIRALGKVSYDETRMAHIHTKYPAYIEETFVSTTGEQVKKGQPLVAVYSPELVSTQEEYLQAYRAQQRNNLPESQELLESARRRLEFWDISSAQIEQLERTGEVRKTLTLHSPFAGVVVERQAIEGMRIQPGTHLYEIADLSEVWVESDIYEYEIPWIDEGQKVEMTLSYMPGQSFTGYVDYIYPYLNSKTRTIKVRSVFQNESGTLKPGMYANVQIHSKIGDAVPAVPEESVIWSGERTLVFLAQGEGRFLPRDVELGALSGDGYYEVLSGVQPGDTVVTSGQFLLDSESKLREALQKMMSVESGEQGNQNTMSGHQH